MTSEPEGLVRNTSMAINYPTSVTKKVAEQFKMVNSMVVNVLVNFFLVEWSWWATAIS